MKALRILAALVFLLVSVGPALADTPSITQGTQAGTYSATASVLGWPGPTKTVTVDNVARTIQAIYEAAGGRWLRGGATATDTISPIGMIFTCDNKATRFAFGGSDPTPTTMHAYPADISWALMGPGLMSTGKWISVSTTISTQCGMTPLY